MPKKIYIRTFGCQINVRDSEVICGLLITNDYELTANPKQADVIILNTCSVRQHAEDKVWSEIGRIAKRGRSKVQPPSGTVEGKVNLRDSPQKSGTVPIIGVVGCMAQNYKDDIFRRAPNVDFVVGPSDIHKIPNIINEIASGRSFGPRNDELKLIKHPSGISIPADAGSIEGVYGSEIASSRFAGLAMTVIHVQDAHANYTAQKNEARIIEHLIRANSINIVLVEGGWGDVSLNHLRNLASLDVRKKVAD